MEDKKAYSEDVHNQIIGWTGNCDSKASFILAFVGIIIPLILTSEYIVRSIEKLLREFIDYWSMNVGKFSITATFMFLFLCIFIFYISRCIMLQISCLTARLTNQPNSSLPSIIFFKSISSQSYEDFVNLAIQKSDEEYLNDKLRQIHICSTICTTKFETYNKGIKALKYGLISFCLFVILTIIFNA